jgi:hypothetical protein
VENWKISGVKAWIQQEYIISRNSTKIKHRDVKGQIKTQELNTIHGVSWYSH